MVGVRGVDWVCHTGQVTPASKVSLAGRIGGAGSLAGCRSHLPQQHTMCCE